MTGNELHEDLARMQALAARWAVNVLYSHCKEMGQPCEGCPFGCGVWEMSETGYACELKEILKDG